MLWSDPEERAPRGTARDAGHDAPRGFVLALAMVLAMFVVGLH